MKWTAARPKQKKSPFCDTIAAMQKPLTIVVFGATGDLFSKKLAPALFDLHQKKLLPEGTEIVGFSRKPFLNDQFRAFIQNALSARAQGGALEPEEFVARARYHQGDLTKQESYASLGIFLAERDRERGHCSDKLFYLAVPPTLYETVFRELAASGLAIPCALGIPDEEKAWTRVLVEKPFGSDECEAERLDKLLGSLFEENQIFRIDHYLAKEAVQNIISFRFSNGLFEPLWNREHIERVEILMHEEGGVGERGAFYDSVGALRDVGQNHILQMLALVAMERPEQFDAAAIRVARYQVLEKVILGGSIGDSAVRGQYEGYKNERGIAPDSQTETYFRIIAGVKNSRWNRVPFVLESGKALTESRVSISVFFKSEPQNVLTFNISPHEEISVVFWAKRPGFGFEVEPKRLSFSFSGDPLAVALRSGYERVLMDCIRGDQTLFAGTAEVKAQWRFITPILEKWGKLPLTLYKKGSIPAA